MTVPTPARLIVLRHAKSAWPPEVDDHERPLGPRGLRDAPAAGRWLREHGLVPDRVVCSPSRRTRATWELVSAELGAALPEAEFDPRIYDAGAAGLLDAVRQTPQDRWTLLLIGHLPGVQDLVLRLARRPRDEAEGEALERAGEKFPTSAIAVLTLPGPWRALAPGTAALTEFVVPRGR